MIYIEYILNEPVFCIRKFQFSKYHDAQGDFSLFHIGISFIKGSPDRDNLELSVRGSVWESLICSIKFYYQAFQEKVKIINLDWERSTHKRRNIIIRLSWQTEKIGKCIQNGNEIRSKFQRTRRRYCSNKGKLPFPFPPQHIWPNLNCPIQFWTELRMKVRRILCQALP